jgi:hypothetical protein
LYGSDDSTRVAASIAELLAEFSDEVRITGVEQAHAASDGNR